MNRCLIDPEGDCKNGGIGQLVRKEPEPPLAPHKIAPQRHEESEIDPPGATNRESVFTISYYCWTKALGAIAFGGFPLAAGHADRWGFKHLRRPTFFCSRGLCEVDCLMAYRAAVPATVSDNSDGDCL
jgi:hypothetical protein